jgi:hypothetical protein
MPLFGTPQVAAGAWRLRSARQNTARALYQITPAPPRPVQARSEPRPAIGQQAPAIEQHIHHHWHGVSPEDVAELIRRDNEQE